MHYIQRISMILALTATSVAAQSFPCGAPATSGSVTVSCVLMPYKALAQANPGLYGTAKSDAIQFIVISADSSVAAYRMTIKVSTLDVPVERLFTATIFNLFEIPVDDIKTATITSIRVEKLRPDPAVEFTAQLQDQL